MRNIKKSAGETTIPGFFSFSKPLSLPLCSVAYYVGLFLFLNLYFLWRLFLSRVVFMSDATTYFIPGGVSVTVRFLSPQLFLKCC